MISIRCDINNTECHDAFHRTAFPPLLKLLMPNEREKSAAAILFIYAKLWHSTQRNVTCESQYIFICDASDVIQIIFTLSASEDI